MTTGIERERQASATSSASVATTTGSMSPLALAARHTHSTIGRPAMSRKTLRGMRVDPRRAGITAAMRRGLMETSVREQGPRDQGTEGTRERVRRCGESEHGECAARAGGPRYSRPGGRRYKCRGAAAYARGLEWIQRRLCIETLTNGGYSMTKLSQESMARDD